MITNVDLSAELKLRPHLNGVSLAPSGHTVSRFMSYGDLKNSSIPTYIMSHESKVVDANEATLHLNHVASLKAIQGKTALDIWRGEPARKMMKHDFHVMNDNSLCITDDTAETVSGVYQPMLTFKVPLYREAKVIGVFGMSLQIDANNIARLAQQLGIITQTGIIKPDNMQQIQSSLQSSKSKMQFSKREVEILAFVVKGYTAEKIANFLKISKRTVENHVQRIKEKSNCSSKYELIAQFHGEDLFQVSS